MQLKILKIQNEMYALSCLNVDFPYFVGKMISFKNEEEQLGSHVSPAFYVEIILCSSDN